MTTKTAQTELPQTVQVDDAWSPTYNERQDRGYKTIPVGSEPCVCCGRLVALDKGWEVHFIFGDRAAVRNDLEPTDVEGFDEGGDMGRWVLGSECGKKVPAAYRLPRDPSLWVR